MVTKEQTIIHDNMELRFVKAIPGFTQMHEYVIKEVEGVVGFYRLLPKDGEYSFILIPTFHYFRTYSFKLPTFEKDLLQVDDESELFVFSLVNWRGGVEQATVNLQAPIVINTTSKLASQILLEDSAYPINEPLLPAIQQSR